MTVVQKNPAIAEAWGVIKVLSADEEARLLAESREKGRRDYVDMMDGAYRDGVLKGKQEGKLEGEQKGMQKGKLEGKFEVARNALRDNMPFEMIAKLTGLALSEIERLASEK